MSKAIGQLKRIYCNKLVLLGMASLVLIGLIVLFYKPPSSNHIHQNEDVLGWHTYTPESVKSSPVNSHTTDTSNQATSNIPSSGDSDSLIINTPSALPSSSPIVIPTFSSDNVSRSVDPNIKIELCQTKSEQERQKAYDEALADYQHTHASTYELAQAVNNDQTEKAALKYGIIKPSDVVRADVLFQQFINSGATMDQARQWSEDGANNYWTYLETLHMQAKGEYDSYLLSIDAQAKNKASHVYSDCLSQ